ncbi:MAG: thiamine-monophosphate kinase [Acidilobaceae archaeon]
MTYERWLELLKELARLSGSEDSLNWDSTPFEGFLINIDGYSASNSKLPWMDWSDWGWKSTVASIADIAATGGKPLAIAYSIGVSSIEEAREIARGVGEAVRWVGARVMKSDTNFSERDRWIDVAVIGKTKRPISRNGARPGDILIQIGAVGYGFLTSLALAGRLDIREYPQVQNYTKRPRPPLSIGLRLGECGATASTDNSDGWIVSLYAISIASGVRIVLEDTIAIEEALEVAQSLDLSLEDVLTSAEDYNIAVTVPPGSVDCVLEACEEEKVEHCSVVGRVEMGRGVYLRDRLLPPSGWTWF